MKNLIIAFSTFSLISGCRTITIGKDEINQNLDSSKGKEIVLVQVINDSRCPEGTQCIWAGEVSIEVAAYENKKLVEQVTLTLNRSTADEVKTWFSEHLPNVKEPLKGIDVLPHPKEGVSIQPKDYKIALKY